MTISHPRVLIALLGAALILTQPSCASPDETASVYTQRLPLKFVRLDGILNVAGGLALKGKVVQQAGQPIVIECEKAASVSLGGSEIARVRDDAGGKLAVRHAGRLSFEFTTVDAGEYRFRIRAFGNWGLTGPANLSIDGKPVSLPKNDRDLGKWTWISSEPFRMDPGAHVMGLSGDTIYWGACLDRVVIGKADMPAPEGIGPEATVCAEGSGTAETEFLPTDGVRRWLSIGAVVAADGGDARWSARQDEKAGWSPIDPSDLSSLSPEKPVQFRLELRKSAAGSSPWVGPANVGFEGSPRTITLAPDVSYRNLPEGGCRISTPEYEVTFASDGRMAALKVGLHDAIVPLENGQGGGWLEGSPGSMMPMGPPELQAGGELAVRGDGIALAWRFQRESIIVDAVQSALLSTEFLIRLPNDVARTIDARTGRETKTIYEKGSPQVFFEDGANLLADDEEHYGGGYGVRLHNRDIKDGPLHLGLSFNYANPWHKRLVLHSRPALSDALETMVEGEPANFIFAKGKTVKLSFPSYLRYDMTCDARAELVCEQLYADAPAAKVVMAQDVKLGSRTTPVEWNVTLPKPGLYRARMAFLKDGRAFREMTLNFCYGIDAVDPPSRPRDIDAFWSGTMKKLAGTPADPKRTIVNESGNSVLYLLSFRSIDGKPAWAYLRLPRKSGRFPAIIHLPPVATPPNAGSDVPDMVQMGIEVRGYDPGLPEREAADKRPVRYTGPGTLDPSETRETLWLYYTYCTMMRAYDILAALPEVDPERIYITGISQGGGLSLALASLRPQNAGVLAIVPGLCRIDWRNSNGGGWGPCSPDGPQHDRLLRDLSYFDVCNLSSRLRSRINIAVGLLDANTPPHAAVNAYHLISEKVREKRIIVNPWMGHSTWPELESIIPEWIENDSGKAN